MLRCQCVEPPNVELPMLSRQMLRCSPRGAHTASRQEPVRQQRLAQWRVVRRLERRERNQKLTLQQAKKAQSQGAVQGDELDRVLFLRGVDLFPNARERFSRSYSRPCSRQCPRPCSRQCPRPCSRHCQRSSSTFLQLFPAAPASHPHPPHPRPAILCHPAILSDPAILSTAALLPCCPAALLPCCLLPAAVPSATRMSRGLRLQRAHFCARAGERNDAGAPSHRVSPPRGATHAERESSLPLVCFVVHAHAFRAFFFLRAPAGRRGNARRALRTQRPGAQFRELELAQNTPRPDPPNSAARRPGDHLAISASVSCGRVRRARKSRAR
jgi:hypothetical protein